MGDIGVLLKGEMKKAVRFSSMYDAAQFIRNSGLGDRPNLEVKSYDTKGRVGVLYNGKLMKYRFDDIIEAGQWISFKNRGKSPEEIRKHYKAVRLTPDGGVIKHAIIQVTQLRGYRQILENHYVSYGYGIPYDRYSIDKKELPKRYLPSDYEISAWVVQ